MERNIANDSHVEFKERSFCIEIYTGSNPMEDWQGLIKSLLWFLGNENPDLPANPEDRHRITQLLQALMPRWEDLSKMNS